jgi:hypothetical protein
VKSYTDGPSRIVEATVTISFSGEKQKTSTDRYRLPIGKTRLRFLNKLMKRLEFAGNESDDQIRRLEHQLRDLGRDPEGDPDDYEIDVTGPNEADADLIEVIRFVERLEDTTKEQRRKQEARRSTL